MRENIAVVMDIENFVGKWVRCVQAERGRVIEKGLLLRATDSYNPAVQCYAIAFKIKDNPHASQGYCHWDKPEWADAGWSIGRNGKQYHKGITLLQDLGEI